MSILYHSFGGLQELSWLFYTIVLNSVGARLAHNDDGFEIVCKVRRGIQHTAQVTGVQGDVFHACIISQPNTNCKNYLNFVLVCNPLLGIDLGQRWARPNGGLEPPQEGYSLIPLIFVATPIAFVHTPTCGSECVLIVEAVDRKSVV